MRAHFTPQAETWRRPATTSRSTILDALSRSFARYGNTARRSQMDRITTWRVQTWAMRYGFAHTEITSLQISEFSELRIAGLGKSLSFPPRAMALLHP